MRPRKGQTSNVRYLGVEDVLSLHAELSAQETVVAHGKPNRNLLESALNRPLHAAYYEDADTIRQAATLFWGLVQDHAFFDGNKRVAWLVLLIFLIINGLNLMVEPDEGKTFVVDVAEGRHDISAVEQWIRDRCSAS